MTQTDSSYLNNRHLIISLIILRIDTCSSIESDEVVSSSAGLELDDYWQISSVRILVVCNADDVLRIRPSLRFILWLQEKLTIARVRKIPVQLPILGRVVAPIQR